VQQPEGTGDRRRGPLLVLMRQPIQGGICNEQVVHQMPPRNAANQTVEVVVHITGQLDHMQRNNLIVGLENTKGFVSAEFCHLRDHLMLVKYDRDQYSSHDVLAAFDHQSVNAKLIGPI
jgi:hypothetical protein